ncbi:leucyl/phenylalanyl-tRNA--protein transferase [uncultured Paenalcaligenes sp.]|uniref:leucyl/phenylalanyl-tRNA--protein transferase n=1 Tax=uncultured Paenalcaligenes sp. TaxID=1588925 RepID=UPI00261A29E0|nr:leucyl/phenylalanyl-tRNA--protein transferase [uncultured Paenalcaligenes sp.]
MPSISIPWIETNEPFPPVEMALDNGLLAAGADLSLPRLLYAYQHGIFPWYNDAEPILWWSPNPRTILQCNQFKLSKSLAKKCRQLARLELTDKAPLRITTDAAFLAVISQCGKTRQHKEGTWISEEIIEAYHQLHHFGFAHSIEVWHGSELVGGLYGTKLGRFFFGESMFSLMTDTSKIALYYLTQLLQHRFQIEYIDCQQETDHLLSLGAHSIARSDFVELLNHYTALETPEWHQGQLRANGDIYPLPADLQPESRA